MIAEQIKNRIDECCSLFAFKYHGKEGHVDPYSSEEFLLWYEGVEMTVNSIDAVMNTPFFDGHTLSDIAGEITITEW